MLVQRSVELGQPLVFVSINYRYASRLISVSVPITDSFLWVTGLDVSAAFLCVSLHHPTNHLQPSHSWEAKKSRKPALVTLDSMIVRTFVILLPGVVDIPFSRTARIEVDPAAHHRVWRRP